ncbi:MAG: MMPL family transporter, partial [Myxococcales bacterium]|nr:MMPL family transporter [Myxococcales bacterium]
ALVSDAGLRAAARRLKRRLSGPMALLVARGAPGDPLSIMPRLFERFAKLRGERGLTLAGGRFVTRDGRHAVLFLSSKASAFDGAAQRPLLAGLRAAFEAVNRRFGGKLVLDASGVNRFAVKTEATIRADIQRISIISAVGLLALMLLLFRSLRLLLVASLPIGVGMLAGCAAVLAVYGQIHGITLAFGASLLGVSFDYVVHLYCHHAVVPAEPRDGVSPGRATLDTIWKAVLTGAATTTAGFAALGASPFGGLREVALFASAGILATLGATRTLVPAMLPARAREVALRERLVEALARALAALRRRRGALWALVAIALVIVAVGAPRLRRSDELVSLGQLDAKLLAEDNRVRRRVAHAEQMVFVAALGNDEQAALRVNDRVAEVLAAARAAGELRAFRSLADVLPSAARQRAIAKTLREAPRLRERFDAAFGAAGFKPGVFAPFFAELRRSPPAEPLSYRELEASPLSTLARHTRLALDGGRVAFLTLLTDLRDGDALARRLKTIDGARLVRQEALMARAGRAYQRDTSRLLVVGLVVVLMLIGVRYRHARRSAAAFVPALLGAAVTMATLALAGIAIDLVAMTSLLVVVSMGVDYGVFLVDAAAEQHERRLAASLLSVVVAGLSTVLGFGLLALSEHPVLRSIGLTAMVGIVACMLLAPAAIVLMGEKR